MANDVVAQAPSRVNLLGDRTDYNDGFVLPLALPFKTVITATPHADNEVPPISAGYGTAAFSLTDEPSTRGLNTSPPWPTFLLMKISRQAGSMPRSRLTSPSEQACRHRRPSRWTRARQSPVSRASSPTPIDCRSLALTPIELPHAAQVIIMDTMTRRELATSAYDDRRHSCERAAAALGLSRLRDATLADLDRIRDLEDRHRAHHVVAENQRALDAVVTLGASDLQAFGCAVALVKRDGVTDFLRDVELGYLSETGITPDLWAVDPSSGAPVTFGAGAK